MTAVPKTRAYMFMKDCKELIFALSYLTSLLLGGLRIVVVR